MPMMVRSTHVHLTRIGAGVFAALLATASSGKAANHITTVAVPHGGRPIAAKTDSKGAIHLLYNSDDGPQYVRSTDNAKTFSHPIAVVDRESRRPGLEFDAWDLALGSGGSIHVAMGTNAWKLKLPQEEWG